MEGWVKIHRSLLGWEWYDKPEMVHLFLHLLLRANYTASAWRGVQVERGQLITGRKNLSQRTGLSPQQVRTCLKRLENTGEITTRSTNSYTIITVCNYESYQFGETESNQRPNQQSTNKQPATNQRSTTSKEGKKGKKDKKEKKTGGGTKLSDEKLGKLKEPWLRYLAYRSRERKGVYKTEQTEKVAFEKLERLSEKDPEKAERIVKQSEENGWTGIFPLDEKAKKNGKQTKEETYRDFLKKGGQ